MQFATGNKALVKLVRSFQTRECKLHMDLVLASGITLFGIVFFLLIGIEALGRGWAVLRPLRSQKCFGPAGGPPCHLGRSKRSNVGALWWSAQSHLEEVWDAEN